MVLNDMGSSAFYAGAIAEEAFGKLSGQLEARKLVERAKGILQREMKIGEEGGYRAIQRQSQQVRKSMKEIAESIILSDELKRGPQ